MSKQNYNIYIESNQLLDAKEGPYFDTATACLNVPREYRQIGQTVKIYDGANTVEYWWKSGIEDSDLILKTVSEKYIGVGTLQDVILDSGVTGDTTVHLTVIGGSASIDTYLNVGSYFTVTGHSAIYLVETISTPSATDSIITITPALTFDSASDKIITISPYQTLNTLLVGNNLTLTLVGPGTFSIDATGGGGTVTSVGTTGLISGGPITTTGTITTSMATNKLVGRSTSGTGIMEEISVGSGLTLSAGTLTNTATPTPTGYYGAWQDDNTQTAPSSNVGVAMIFRTIDLSNGVSVVTNGTNLTRITFANTGIYNLQFSSQFQNTSNQLEDVTIWLRKNGSDVAGSSGYISVPNSHGGIAGHCISSWNYLLDIVAGEYYELVWSTTNHTAVTMQYYAAGSPPPSTASVILTVTQQSGIMAGTGITAINSLTGSAQTITTGTTGNDIAISSSGTTHTLNIPTASSTKRGALSSTDWSTFNSKQDTITGAATTITSSNLTASRVLVSDSSGKVSANTVTTTTLGYLDATSSIQTQINSKQATLTNPVTGTGTNNEIAAFNSTGSTITSLTTSTYPSLTELSYIKGLTSAIQTQINALPRVVYTNYTAETTTSTSTTNALTTFTLTISDANWPLGGVLRLNGLLERTAGSGSIFMGLVCNGSQARYFSAAGQSMQWEWQIIKEAANTLRIGMGPSNTGNGSYAVHNTSTTTATASGGNYVFTFYMFVGTSGATASMRWMKGIMIP